MALPPDLIELLREFDEHRVRYLLIGGQALGFHSEPRFTKDFDFWIGSDTDDVARLTDALQTFGAPQTTVEAVRALNGLDVAWMGNPPLRFDFMKEVPGGNFEEAYARRVSAQWQGTNVSIVSLEDLIRLKRASGRPQDQVDVAALETAKRGKNQE